MRWRRLWPWGWVLVAGCTSLTGPDCRFRVAVLPGETEAEAIQRTVPKGVIQACGKELSVDYVYVMGD